MQRIKTAAWMGAAFVIGAAIATTAYLVADPSQRLAVALRSSARWSFLWFCLATYGGALTVLWGPSFRGLARRARELGLAFAAAQTVHVILVAWLLLHSPNPFPRLPLVIFSIGVFCTYVLTLFSLSSRLSGRLGPGRWKFVRTIGVEYLAFAYVYEFSGRILNGNRANALHYMPLLLIAAAGPMLRLAASFKRRSNTERTTALLSS